MVYEDAEALYAEVQKVGGQLLEEAFKVLCPGSISLLRGSSLGTSDFTAGKIIAFNTTPFPRTEVVKLPLTSGNSQLANTILQPAQDGNGFVVMHSPEAGGVCTIATSPSDHLIPVSGETMNSCLTVIYR